MKQIAILYLLFFYLVFFSFSQKHECKQDGHAEWNLIIDGKTIMDSEEFKQKDILLDAWNKIISTIKN